MYKKNCKLNQQEFKQLQKVKSISPNFCDIFHQSAKIHSSRIAVCFENQEISFSELDHLSSIYASHLIEAGVKKGDILALTTYNQIELIPIILGIWKSGGVYLPIDPNYPIKRIADMLEEAQPKLLLTSNELKESFEVFTSEIFIIDQLTDQSKKKCKSIKLPKIKKNDLAYLIFTSGSTGRPKGVMIEHQGLTHAALAYKDMHPKRFTALAAGSISFDPNLLTIIFCLVTGSTICLYDNKEGIDIEDSKKIVKLIKKKQIDFILTTPTFYLKILENNTSLPSLKNIDLCGENIPNNLIEKHIKLASNAFLHNAYGPTEYAIGSTMALLFDPIKKKKFKITIGKSFSGNQVYVLNSKLKETKVYKKGEIYTGGPGLARGYLNQKDLTDKHFIWITSPENKKIRVYKTGDVGYRLLNGDIVFAGRTDFQVKISGHRVEIEEIESIIDNLPYIEKSIVTVQRLSPSKIKLVAFFTSNNASSKKLLQRDLVKMLPSYMIPNELCKIPEFPITENGKVNREAQIFMHV